jgi:hypothetical protein
MTLIFMHILDGLAYNIIFIFFIKILQKRLKVDFRGFVSMSSHLADIVERLLEPAPEDRFQV